MIHNGALFHIISPALTLVCCSSSPCPSRSPTSHASVTSPYQSQGAPGMDGERFEMNDDD